MDGLKMGTDPECFIFDTKERQYVSAHDIIPGSKKEPYKVLYGAVQPDGLAAEFNIEAVDNLEDWERNISTVIEILTGMVKEKSKDYELRFVPVADFDPEYFKRLPEEAKILGCDPDYAYTGIVNPNPSDKLAEMPFRTAAGHIHLGWTKDQELTGAHFNDCKYISYNFLYHAMYTASSLEERRRLKYYGMNSSFRPKPYGVEIRSPSNIWVSSKESRARMFTITKARMAELYRQTAAIRQAA